MQEQIRQLIYLPRIRCKKNLVIRTKIRQMDARTGFRWMKWIILLSDGQQGRTTRPFSIIRSMRMRFENYILLGDSGYRKNMVTFFLNIESRSTEPVQHAMLSWAVVWRAENAICDSFNRHQNEASNHTTNYRGMRGAPELRHRRSRGSSSGSNHRRFTYSIATRQSRTLRSRYFGGLSVCTTRNQ